MIWALDDKIRNRNLGTCSIFQPLDFLKKHSILNTNIWKGNVLKQMMIDEENDISQLNHTAVYSWAKENN